MAQETINTGSSPNDGTGDDLRTAHEKTNSNFTELYGKYGTISIGDIGNPSVGSFYTVTGDISSAEIIFIETGGATTGEEIEVTLSSPMPSTNYFVRMYIEGFVPFYDNSTVYTPAFTVSTTAKFNIVLREGTGVGQNIKLHLEIIDRS